MANKKPVKFTDVLKVSKKLPPSMQSHLRGATLEEGRQALKTFRKTGKSPKAGLQKGEKEFAKDYGGGGALMRGSKKPPRKRR